VSDTITPVSSTFLQIMHYTLFIKCNHEGYFQGFIYWLVAFVFI